MLPSCKQETIQERRLRQIQEIRGKKAPISEVIKDSVIQEVKDSVVAKLDTACYDYIQPSLILAEPVKVQLPDTVKKQPKPTVKKKKTVPKVKKPAPVKVAEPKPKVVEPPKPIIVKYVIGQKETYFGIARKLNMSPKDIMRANNNRKLHPGDTIILIVK